MSLYDTGLFVRGLYRGGLFDQSLWETAGSSIFDRLQDLDQPMVVAYEGANPLETGRYPQPTTVLAFDGVDQYVDCNSVLIPATGDFTIEVTFKAPVANAVANQPLVSQYDSGSDGRFSLIYNTNLNDVRIFIGHSSGNFDVLTAGGLTVGQWYTAKMMRTGNLFEIYIDGVLAASGSSSYSVHVGNNTFIGSDGVTGFFNNSLSNVTINDTNYPLNQTTGTIALDRNDNANAGTLVNGPVWTVDNTLPWAADITNEEGVFQAHVF